MTKLSEKCENCKCKDSCDEKRMAACAYICEQPLMAQSAQPLTSPLAADVAVKHDYRDVKVSENIVITIDLEDLKRKLERDIYKHLYPFNYGA